MKAIDSREHLYFDYSTVGDIGLQNWLDREIREVETDIPTQQL